MREFVSAAYTLSFVAGSVLSWRRDIPAQPFALGTSLGVRKDIILGVGCGLAAPWPMVVLLLRSRKGNKLAPVLWALFLIGALSEPVTHRVLSGEGSAAEFIVVGANLILPVAALAAA